MAFHCPSSLCSAAHVLAVLWLQHNLCIVSPSCPSYCISFKKTSKPCWGDGKKSTLFWVTINSLKHCESFFYHCDPHTLQLCSGMNKYSVFMRVINNVQLKNGKITLIAVFVIEQERPRTVGFFFKKIHQSQNPHSAFSWLCFHKKQWVQKLLRTEVCHEKAVWKTSPQ